MSATIANGEINCLDSGGYNIVTITKSITIDCAGTVAGINTTGGAAIQVMAPSGKVILRSLVLNGLTLGINGIDFVSGSLELDNVKMEGFTGSGVSSFRTTAGILTVQESTFSDMPNGIKVRTTGGNLVVSVTGTRFNNLSGNGVEAGMNTYAAVSNSVFAALNGTAILAATATSTVYAENNIITNTATGISAAVAGAKINANGNTIYGNSKAFNVVAGATFLSGGGNKLDINPGNPATGSLIWK